MIMWRIRYILRSLSEPKDRRRGPSLPFPQGQKRGKRTWRD